MLKNKRWLWAGALALLTTLILILVWQVLSIPIVPVSPPSDLILTAEYLEVNPAPYPHFLLRYETRVRKSYLFEKSIMIIVGTDIWGYAEPEGKPLYILKINGVQANPNENYSPASRCHDWTYNFTPEPGDPCDYKELYFDASNLLPGLHLAEISIPYNDLTFTWAFRYDPNSPTADPNILPTLMPLPTLTPSATS